MITGGAVDRSQVVRSLIRRLDAIYREGLESGPGPLARRWAERLEPMGRMVVLETRAGEIAGRLVEADLLLGLRLALAEAQERVGAPRGDHGDRRRGIHGDR